MLQRLATRTRDRLDRSRREIAVESVELLRSLHPARIRDLVAASGFRWLVNLAVAILVLSLPLAATAASHPTASGAGGSLAQLPSAEMARALTVSRGGVIAAGRSPVTQQAEGVRPIVEYTFGPADSLGSIANFFKVSSEAIAFANGITDPLNIEKGRGLRIPPGEGALYTVAEGDTVESVAARFKVEASVIRDYNRLHFEPEHFAPGKLVFIEGATLPGLVYQTVDAEPEKPTVITRALAPAPALDTTERTGRLAWPTGGRITQHMWGGHTGVDLAAPYGTGLGAGDDGIVSKTGWVPVGGLSVCVKHAGNLESCYYHTGTVFVAPGQRVTRGQIIATIGLTGVTTGPHVHWETKLNGVLVNPLAQ